MRTSQKRHRTANMKVSPSLSAESRGGRALSSRHVQRRSLPLNVRRPLASIERWHVYLVGHSSHPVAPHPALHQLLAVANSWRAYRQAPRSFLLYYRRARLQRLRPQPSVQQTRMRPDLRHSRQVRNLLSRPSHQAEAAAEKRSRAGGEVAVGIGVAVGPGLKVPAAAMAAAADWMPVPWKEP